MAKSVSAYFSDIVLPAIAERFPWLVGHMSVQLQGSFGLGIADQYSDLDAVIWLDDAHWQSDGAALQLMLIHDIPRFLTTTSEQRDHPEIVVHPVSWLGRLHAFLEDGSDQPWEEVAVEQLFQIQKNVVLVDASDTFGELRQATAPQLFPLPIWRKRLIKNLLRLQEDMSDWRKTILRRRSMESSILTAEILRTSLTTGFLICRQYWPWRTHLRWAFAQLDRDVASVLPWLDELAGSTDLDLAETCLNSVLEAFTEAIIRRDLLSRDILADLLWADRLAAWDNSKWQDYLKYCRTRAEQRGWAPEDFWIVSLWK